MKYFRFCFYFLLLVLFSWHGFCANNDKVPQNELPMYGGVPRTPAEKAADEKFVQDVTREFGSKEAAFENGFELGWAYYAKRDYVKAMYRFNQCWLLNPDDVRLNNAFGVVMAARGDLKSAVSWFQKGADKGDPKAQFNLAKAYMNGQGIKQSPKDAVKWYRLAAEQGLEWAQNMLGVCYEYGLGTPRNTVEANQWYEKADANGATAEEKKWRHKIDENVPPEGEMVKEE